MAIKAKKGTAKAGNGDLTTKSGSSLDKTLTLIAQKYGKSAVHKGLERIEKSATGILGFDLATKGGVSMGKIIEIYGMESSGKTTLNLAIGAALQRKNKKTGYIDAEHALDADYMATLGYDVEKALISQPEYGEMALEILNMLIESGEMNYLTVDSVAALTPKAEIEGEMGDHVVGKQAKLMSQALRKTIASASRNKTTVCYINQLRQKIGVMFGNPEVTTAGLALQFYASTRIKTRICGQIKKGDEQIGVEIELKFVKNKNASPNKTIVLRIIFGYGYDKVDSLLEEAINAGVVTAGGAWLNFPNGEKAQGKDQARLLISTNRDLTKNLVQKTVEALIDQKKLTEDYLKEVDFLTESVMEFGYYRDLENNRLVALDKNKIKGDVQEDVATDYDLSVEFLGDDNKPTLVDESDLLKAESKEKSKGKTKGKRGRPKAS